MSVGEQLIYSAAAPFEAARQVLILPEGHRSRRLHGHSFTAKMWAELPLGWSEFPGGEIEKLRSRLSAALAPLDYQHLNLRIDQPTDENLARWIRRQVDVPGLLKIGVLSTPHEGVDLDRHEHAHVWRRYVLQSAHQLPNVKPGHKCGRMHGHGFEVILHADQDLGTSAISVDYNHLDELWSPLHTELDHACLNDVPGLENPTSELISAWIWHRLKSELPELSWVTVYETASCGAHFDGNHYRIWKESTFDSALRLRYAPTGDRRRRIHGHTYTLRLHLSAPLDEVMGWAIDFGDVKDLFDPIFKRIDHHPLHEIPSLEDTDAASIAHWIKKQAEDRLPNLDRIDLFETPGCGVVLSWGELGPALPI
jgi:6-pyruvoyltetrahydropterin/6-carboxytetrahydropterin synthase